MILGHASFTPYNKPNLISAGRSIDEKHGGSTYMLPPGLNDEKFCQTVNELIALAKTKDLSVRQAQCVFSVCADRILDHTFN